MKFIVWAFLFSSSLLKIILASSHTDTARKLGDFDTDDYATVENLETTSTFLNMTSTNILEDFPELQKLGKAKNKVNTAVPSYIGKESNYLTEYTELSDCNSYSTLPTSIWYDIAGGVCVICQKLNNDGTFQKYFSQTTESSLTTGITTYKNYYNTLTCRGTSETHSLTDSFGVCQGYSYMTTFGSALANIPTGFRYHRYFYLTPSQCKSKRHAYGTFVTYASAPANECLPSGYNSDLDIHYSKKYSCNEGDTTATLETFSTSDCSGSADAQSTISSDCDHMSCSGGDLSNCGYSEVLCSSAIVPVHLAKVKKTKAKVRHLKRRI